MRKIFIQFSLLVVLIIIASCSNENIIDAERNAIKQVDPNALSENEVISIVESFQKSIKSETNSRGEITENPIFAISEKYLISSRNSEITRSLPNDVKALVYEVEIRNRYEQGKAIVSGDRKFPKVLAYIPSYNDSIFATQIGANAMIQMSKNALLDEIANNSEAITRSRPITDLDGQVWMMIEPFCTTEWGQKEPYSWKFVNTWVEIPMDISRKICTWERRPVGLTNTAIAQIMASLEPELTCEGISMDWSYLKESKSISYDDPYEKWNMVASLFKYVYDSTSSSPVWGTAYTDVWPDSESKLVSCITAISTPLSNVYKYLNSGSGITNCGNIQKWSIETVKNSVIKICPVLVECNGSAFIVDGYAMTKNESSSSNAYFHCNFGKTGNSDGYYLVNNDGSISFETGGNTYWDTQLSVIPDIRKR